MRESFIFGITVGLAIGPMAMIIIYRSCTGGTSHGIVTGLGVGMADLTYAIIAFGMGGVLVNYLQNNAILFKIISGIVLLVFGIYMLQKSLHMTTIKTIKEQKRSLIKDFISAYGLTIINPLTIVLFRGFSGQIVSTSTTFGSIIGLSLLLFLGSLLIQLSIALISGRVKSKINNTNILRKINVIASIVVITFAIKGLIGR